MAGMFGKDSHAAAQAKNFEAWLSFHHMFAEGSPSEQKCVCVPRCSLCCANA